MPAIPPRDRKSVLGRVFDREAVTIVVQEWLRTSLAAEGKGFLLARGVAKKRTFFFQRDFT
jgi:hypothetical protein